MQIEDDLRKKILIAILSIAIFVMIYYHGRHSALIDSKELRSQNETLRLELLMLKHSLESQGEELGRLRRENKLLEECSENKTKNFDEHIGNDKNFNGQFFRLRENQSKSFFDNQLILTLLKTDAFEKIVEIKIKLNHNINPEPFKLHLNDEVPITINARQYNLLVVDIKSFEASFTLKN